MPTKIYFGKGQEDNIGSLLKKAGAKKVLLHYGGNSLKKSGLYDKIINNLKASKLEVVELGGVLPNPRLSLVYEGISLCKKHNVDFILAAGGGSVIDSAKAIAAGSCTDGDVWDFFVKGKQIRKALPLATILTIPAAGSESSDSMVITKEEEKLKRATGSEYILPLFSILNPEFCFSLPKNQIANGISDILAHMMERYFTQVKNVDFTDALIEAGMKTVIKHAPIVINQPNSYDSWAEIMWAGSVGHNNLFATGRIGDWASHMIEHEISGLYDVAHGAGLSVVFPAWMKYVYKTDLPRFCRFAHEIFNVPMDYFNLENMALMGISALTDFFKNIGLPTTAAELNLDSKDFSYMAKTAVNGSKDTYIGQFVKLYEKDILNIYHLTV